MSVRELVYGLVGEGLVFISREQAQELAALWTGFGTWAEARTALSPQRWQNIVDQFEGAELPLPAPGDPFDLSRVPGNGDGNWPEWPAQQMLEWMPVQVAALYGQSVDSLHDGHYLELDPQREAELVAALGDEGWTCIRDDALACAASGFVEG